MAQEGDGGEQVEQQRGPEHPFSGSLTPEQSATFLHSLARGAKFSVNIIPVSESFGDLSISPAISRAAAEEFASLVRRAGWQAHVLDTNPHPSARPLGAIALVTHPHSRGEMPRRGRKGAQFLRQCLEELGIQAESYSSNKVDPETFEMHITIRTRP